MTNEDFDRIKSELLTQDNRITADPLFVVFEKERIFVRDDGSDDVCYVDHYDSDYPVYDTIADVYESYEREIPPGCCESSMLKEFPDIEAVNYIEKPRFVTACFTEKGALDYIKANGHNLREPYIFVVSLYRNAEMIAIRNMLMAGGEREQ